MALDDRKVTRTYRIATAGLVLAEFEREAGRKATEAELEAMSVGWSEILRLLWRARRYELIVPRQK